MLGRIGWFGGGDALLDDCRGLPCRQPKLPNLGAAFFGEEARVIQFSRERQLRLDTRLPEDIAGADNSVLRIGPSLALEGQCFLEVEGNHRLLGELQHEVAQRSNSNLLADRL